MDFNKVSTFVSVAELGSITLAAQSLRRSQSAISQQIQALESELGLRLLERRNAKVFLSKDGQRIFTLARANLGHLNDGILALKKSASSVTGHIAVGVLNDFGTDFHIGKAIGNFCQRYPGVSFSVQVGASPQLERDLVDNKIDLGIFVFFQDPSLFHRKAIEKSSHSLYTSAKHLKERGAIEGFRDVLSRNLVDLSDELPCLSTFFKKNAPRWLPSLKHRRPNVIAPNLEVVKQILLSGYGLAMLPDFLVCEEVRSRRLVRLLPSSKSLVGILDVAYRTNRTLPLCEHLFVDHLASSKGRFRITS